MRLFLAVSLPESNKRELARIQGTLKVGRLADPDTFHLTLLFLGDVSDAQAVELNDGLEALRIRLPQIVLRGIGHFGHDGPRAVWIGAAPDQPLQALHGKLAQLARSVGVPLRRRKFVPHVTLARLRGDPADSAAVAAFAARHARFELAAFQTFALTLFRSHLRPEGPIYESLADYPVSMN